MGVIYESMERFYEAKRYYCKVRPKLRFNIDQSVNLTLIDVRIATCYTALKIHTKAIQRYIQALEQSQMIGDSILIGKVRAHLGIAYLKANEYNKVIEQFVDVIILMDVIARPFVHEIYLIIAETLLKVNDIINAMIYYEKFVDRFEEDEEHDPELWSNTCERLIYCLGCIWLEIADFTQSFTYCMKAIRILVSKPDLKRYALSITIIIDNTSWHREVTDDTKPPQRSWRKQMIAN
ncbi:unnamed protein product [Rotaria sordida]|nr:unnamed protein product [Rotaria sordida]